MFPIQDIWLSEPHFGFAVYTTSALICSLIFLRFHLWFMFKDCYMGNRTLRSSSLEEAEIFSGCLEAHTQYAVQFTSLRACPQLLEAELSFYKQSWLCPHLLQEGSNDTTMGTASLYLVPYGLVLLIDVFCWLKFCKFGCSGFVGLVLLT